MMVSRVPSAMTLGKNRIDDPFSTVTSARALAAATHKAQRAGKSAFPLTDRITLLLSSRLIPPAPRPAVSVDPPRHRPSLRPPMPPKAPRVQPFPGFFRAGKVQIAFGGPGIGGQGVGGVCPRV